MPVTGMNGVNESFIDSSRSIGLSLYDSSNKKINVANLISSSSTSQNALIDMYISRNTETDRMKKLSYVYVNMSLYSSYRPNDQNDAFLQNGLTISQANSSLIVNIKPDFWSNNSSLSDLLSNVGFLSLFKFGSNPRLNDTYIDYDLWKLSCPFDLIRASNESGSSKNSTFYFSLFVSQSEMASYQGYVGFALRQLTQNEIIQYCSSSSSTSTSSSSISSSSTISTPLSAKMNAKSPPVAVISDIISNPYKINLFLRAYSSACYYYDQSTTRWSSHGLYLVESGTNESSVHCQSTHLTDFAGGFVVLPAAIDFDYVFANASFNRNLTIYITVIVIVCLYILASLVCFYFDKRDKKRVNFVYLKDNKKLDEYYYEIIVFTGSRLNAGTNSQVYFSPFLFDASHEAILSFFIISDAQR